MGRAARGARPRPLRDGLPACSDSAARARAPGCQRVAGSAPLLKTAGRRHGGPRRRARPRGTGWVGASGVLCSGRLSQEVEQGVAHSRPKQCHPNFGPEMRRAGSSGCRPNFGPEMDPQAWDALVLYMAVSENSMLVTRILVVGPSRGLGVVAATSVVVWALWERFLGEITNMSEFPNTHCFWPETCSCLTARRPEGVGGKQLKVSGRNMYVLRNPEFLPHNSKYGITEFNDAGDAHDLDEDGAAALADHWRRTFDSVGGVDLDAMKRPRNGIFSARLVPPLATAEGLRRALSRCPCGAPGLDGIACAHWAGVGDIAVQALHGTYLGVISVGNPLGSALSGAMCLHVSPIVHPWR